MDTSSVLVTQTQKRRPVCALETVFAWCCLLIGYLFCRAFPVNDNALGTVIVFTLTVLLTVVMLILKKASYTLLSVLSGILTLVFSVSILFTQNGILQFICSLFSVTSYTVFVYLSCGNKKADFLSDFFILDIFYAAFILPARSFREILYSLIPKGKINLRPLVKILAGLSMAMLPTIVIVVLLSYDSGFSELINKATDFDITNIVSHLISILFGFPIGMYLFGLFISSVDKKGYKAPLDEILTDAVPAIKIVPHLTAIAAVLPIMFVYLLFFISQFKYYVLAFTGILPENLSYADYARDGFFQLCSVSVINLIIIIAISLFIRRNGNKPPLVQKIICVTLSLMTLVLISTALSKMFLYIDTYGLTPKRVYATWFIIVLSLIFILVLLKQFISKFPLIILSVCVVIAMLLGLVFSQPDTLIAEYNVEHYISGDLEQIDFVAMRNLGDAAVPALVKLTLHMDEQNNTNALNNFSIILEGAQHHKYTEEYVKLCYTLHALSNRESKIWDITIVELRAGKELVKVGLPLISK